ncbi:MULTISPECIES: DUF6879 family protein [Actinomadura]|uniref:DUF6879 family protein n=1 Tax=Actinomadura yumaensis TaxID=111807 RepID=A0ABW2CEM7_9ACTN|nr:DUF6879 family protein [Actinomadura sp. J1-007]MWK34603.1 hypothetical protein [Actinomadura sp. J1-007]
MEPIEYHQFQSMLRSAERAWHLELRDTYSVEFEEAPLDRWRKGEPDDFAWLEDWLQFIRELVANGVDVQRLRLVSEPHSEYTEWSISVTPLNVSAGENVRYLPRAMAKDIEFPEEDCWILDDDRLILSLFKQDGGSAGFAVEQSPGLLARYLAVRDVAWSRAIPFGQYVNR